jgi:hypothetical protein
MCKKRHAAMQKYVKNGHKEVQEKRRERKKKKKKDVNKDTPCSHKNIPKF